MVFYFGDTVLQLLVIGGFKNFSLNYISSDSLIMFLPQIESNYDTNREATKNIIIKRIFINFIIEKKIIEFHLNHGRVRDVLYIETKRNGQTTTSADDEFFIQNIIILFIYIFTVELYSTYINYYFQ